jgi:hypothetical protein
MWKLAASSPYGASYRQEFKERKKNLSFFFILGKRLVMVDSRGYGHGDLLRFLFLLDRKHGVQVDFPGGIVLGL